MNFKIISYYCDVDDSKYYEKCYHRLKKKLDEYDYDYDMVKVENLGSYKENCRRKPNFIIDKIKEHDEDVVWLDIDTILINRMTEVDIIPPEIDLTFASSNGNIGGCKASPIFIKNNERSKKFLHQWRDNVNSSRDQQFECFDHEVLFHAIQVAGNYCNIGFLNENYCTWPGRENENTVILMGLSDNESKKDSLRKMGMCEKNIKHQTTGLYHE
jgi:hypothetical protein